MATWTDRECSVSPDGKHDFYATEIEVRKKGKKITVMGLVCRWCGAQRKKK